jgi:hypothetical protein
MATERVKPALGKDGTPMLVRMPERAWRPLDPEGEEVEVNEWWARRLAQGDVERCPAEPELASDEPLDD